VGKPVILVVDDDTAVLAAIERDLRQRYREDYRVMKASSGEEALDAAQTLATRANPVALFLVDQRMPGMTGIEFLRQAQQLHPQARRVLLTAYADTDVAIAGINEIGLEHYLMKPWDPPEDHLYPVLDDFLAEWRSRARPPYEGVRVLGSQWSAKSFAVRDFLSRNRVPYEWSDVEVDAPARTLAQSLTNDLTRLPVVILPDGTALVAPTTTDLATRVGMKTHADSDFYQLIVIGGGPAGLANAVYAASEGLRTVLVETHAAGGQAGTSSMIENYLGFPSGIPGADLAQRAATQARRFGAEILTGVEVVSLRREDPYRVVALSDGTELRAYTIVIATGLSARTLDVPGIEALHGAGVYYGAAMSEAARFRDREVCVVGGANSAGQGALFFSRFASRVTMLVRAAGLGIAMSDYLVKRIEATENIDVLCGATLQEVLGKGSLEAVVVRTGDGEVRSIPAAAIFIFIGVRPHTDAFEGVIERDAGGFVLTGGDIPRDHGRPRGWTLDRDPFMFETSVPGVFAAGDVRSGSNHRVAAAVGEGSAAIYSVHRYLQTV
jgi:thioredoxin reductase (NADPH)